MFEAFLACQRTMLSLFPIQSISCWCWPKWSRQVLAKPIGLWKIVLLAVFTFDVWGMTTELFGCDKTGCYFTHLTQKDWGCLNYCEVLAMRFKEVEDQEGPHLAVNASWSWFHFNEPRHTWGILVSFRDKSSFFIVNNSIQVSHFAKCSSEEDAIIMWQSLTIVGIKKWWC